MDDLQLPEDGVLIIDESVYIREHRDDDAIGRAALASATPGSTFEDCTVGHAELEEGRRS